MEERELQEKVRRALEGRERVRLAPPGFRPSAVLIPLFIKEGRPHVLLTRRSSTLAKHKGEICFPGGRVDPSDERPRAAALREAREELGLRETDVELLGALGDFLTITYFVITPWVGFIKYPFELVVSRDEIARVIEMPLEDLTAPGVFEERYGMRFMDRPYPVYYFRTREHTVWGATGKILKQLLEVAFDWRAPEAPPAGPPYYPDR